MPYARAPAGGRRVGSSRNTSLQMAAPQKATSKVTKIQGGKTRVTRVTRTTRSSSKPKPKAKSMAGPTITPPKPATKDVAQTSKQTPRSQLNRNKHVPLGMTASEFQQWTTLQKAKKQGVQSRKVADTNCEDEEEKGSKKGKGKPNKHPQLKREKAGTVHTDITIFNPDVFLQRP